MVGLSHTPSQEPVSQCSPQCEEGQVRRVKGFHSCCYDCIDCMPGSYQHSPGKWRRGQVREDPGRRGGRLHPSADFAHR